MHSKSIISVLVTASLLLGCGSSDSDSPEPTTPEVTPPDTSTPPDTTTPPEVTEYDHQVTGLAVFQGALAGADICVDLNLNRTCDSNEPITTTDVDGNYQVDWTSEEESPEYYLLADWIAAPNSNNPAQAIKLNFKNAIEVQNINRVISPDGQGQLIALPEHSGAINSLTNIQFSRMLEMTDLGLAESKINSLMSELSVLLAAVYKQDALNPYQVTVANSQSDDFLAADAFHRYLDEVIAGQVPELLALENILGISYSDLQLMLQESNLTLEEFIALDPLAARIIISNAAIYLGYTDTPIDKRIMGQVDWDIVLDNLLNESGFKHTFSLQSNVDFSSFSLLNKSLDKRLAGFVMNDQVSGFEFSFSSDSGNEITTKCWNNEVNTWLEPDEIPEGYERPTPYADGNQYVLHYSGTTTPINFHFSKYFTADNEWDNVLDTTASALTLNQLTWPETLYRVKMEQTEDVICRRTDGNDQSFAMPEYSSTDDISTTDIVMAFFSSEYPDLTDIDNENKTFTTKDYQGELTASYQWKIITSPNDKDMIEVVKVPLVVGAPAIMESTYYLLENTAEEQLAIEVSFYPATSEESLNAPLIVTYDEETYEFTDALYQHLLGLMSTQP
ncbi:hypothetical protein [Shewanella sp. 10N.286.52.B9]|uniref:hypothetical protein n=1 Tax=Shewanella sp. 10N.286.52.B9 TaxID=1880837 RepID=UPI000C854121|nr:hypothetical protein [Shewanella sp. 10N.286.52.B9]PMG43570.1 hypothetical protein BCU91_04630 [Shewanella sp. 10N.286.52.B9]